VTYFEDLSKYSYFPSAVLEHWEQYQGWDVRCVGWLDGRRDYSTGPTVATFRDALLRLCTTRTVARTRGFHVCNLPPCDPRSARGP
jgi:hypothetical protein